MLFRVWLPLAFVVAAMAITSASQAAAEQPSPKIPVILDTDIGDDIDDTWALALLLNCPELDVKLIVTDYGKVPYRAKMLAKLLEIAGRTDIPIGLGAGELQGGAGQDFFVADYDLDSYSGVIHQDGVGALIDVVNASEQPIKIIAMGPLPTLADALKRSPDIARKAELVGMYGAVRKGYGGSDEVGTEHNIRADVAASQTVFTAPWSAITITPLDTCGLVDLKGDRFARVRDSDDPVLRALIENYYVWVDETDWFVEPAAGRRSHSSILYDVVPVYLAIREELCQMETLPIRVTDDGRTVIDAEAGKPMRVATEWNDLEAFKDWLVDRLVPPGKQ